MDRAIIDYYDALAPTYDTERFGNPYGAFLDKQERAILGRFLPKRASRVLEIGCGTGRLTDLATVGCDASLASLAVARARRPDRSFVGVDALALAFPGQSFDAAFSFHVFMHLEIEVIRAISAEVARVLKPGGIFIADIASRRRRALRGRETAGWHCSGSMTASELGELGNSVGLRLRTTAGVALAPVHRLPDALRNRLAGLDLRLAALRPDWASFLVGCFVRE